MDQIFNSLMTVLTIGLVMASATLISAVRKGTQTIPLQMIVTQMDIAIVRLKLGPMMALRKVGASHGWLEMGFAICPASMTGSIVRQSFMTAALLDLI
jgi:hypothetical protein